MKTNLPAVVLVSAVLLLLPVHCMRDVAATLRDAERVATKFGLARQGGQACGTFAPAVNNNLTVCHAYNGISSCCNPTIEQQILRIAPTANVTRAFNNENCENQIMANALDNQATTGDCSGALTGQCLCVPSLTHTGMLSCINQNDKCNLTHTNSFVCTTSLANCTLDQTPTDFLNSPDFCAAQNLTADPGCSAAGSEVFLKYMCGILCDPVYTALNPINDNMDRSMCQSADCMSLTSACLNETVDALQCSLNDFTCPFSMPGKNYCFDTVQTLWVFIGPPSPSPIHTHTRNNGGNNGAGIYAPSVLVIIFLLIFGLL